MADVGVGNVGQWFLDPDVDGRIAADQRFSRAFHLLRARLHEHGAHERGDMPSDAGSGAIARHVHRIDRLAQQGFGDLVHAVHAQGRNQVVPQVLAVFFHGLFGQGFAVGLAVLAQVAHGVLREGGAVRLLLQLLELRRHPCAPYDVAFRVVKPGFRIDREPQREVLVDPFLATQLVGPLAVRPYRRLIRCLKVSGVLLVWFFLEVAEASSAHVGLFRKKCVWTPIG